MHGIRIEHRGFACNWFKLKASLYVLGCVARVRGKNGNGNYFVSLFFCFLTCMDLLQVLAAMQGIRRCGEGLQAGSVVSRPG